MKALNSDKLRVFLVHWVFTSIYGLTFREWMQLLRKHHFAVDPPYVPRAAFITLASLINSAVHSYENAVFTSKVRDVEIQPPLFILGHWRSGTTFLHNMLSLDEQFAYANLWQATNPHTFLTTEGLANIVRWVAPKTRLTDNVRYAGDSPFEDQFATTGTLRTPFLRWAFPRSASDYDPYMTFRDVPDHELEEWKAALVLFYKKLTWKYNRPLLLKSPVHTCRIKIFLDMFPNARFIHIHRNPYDVFQSSKKETEVISQVTRLQRPVQNDMDAWILCRYKKMYDIFFEERDLIPKDQIYEMRYEDLIRDPVEHVRSMYEHLHLDGFADLRPKLQQHVDSLGTYRKNTYANLSVGLSSTIRQAWHQSFERWGYAVDSKSHA